MSTALAPSPVFPGRTLLESEEGLDPRVKRTRQLLRQALVSLLGEKGFESISVQDIAERATVNRVTFYDHFDDKYALLDSLIDENFRDLLRSRTVENRGTARERLEPFLLAVCDYLGKLNGCCKTLRQPLFEPLVESRIKTLLCDLLRSRLEAEDADRLRLSPALGATLAGWSIYGAALEWSREGGAQALPAERLADQVLPALTAALYGN